MKKGMLTLLVVSTIMVLALSTGPALAGPKIFDSGPSTCGTVNCGASLLSGTYTHDQNSNADPFVMQVFTAGGECLRIDVLSEGTDLEAVLVGPDGRVWRVDDRPGSLLPLIKAITTAGVRGWCTLQLSHFAGSGVNADFTVAIGRYNAANINCASPTGSFGAESFIDEEKAAKDEDAGNRPLRGGTTE